MIFNMLTSSKKYWGMIEIEKLGTNYYVVGCMHFFEEFIFLLKVRPVSSAQDHFLMWFLDFPPEKVQRCKFSWRLALQNSSYNNLIRYRKFKMADFWKKGPKITQFSISQEPFRVRWKDFAHICFLLEGTFEQNLIKTLEGMGDKI